MKLTVNTFNAGMKIMSYTYPDWKYDINNKEMVGVWYMKLSGMISEEDFMKAVNIYTDTQSKAPGSPVEFRDSYLNGDNDIYALEVGEAITRLSYYLVEHAFDENEQPIIKELRKDEIFKPLLETYRELAPLCGSPINREMGLKLSKDDYFKNLFIKTYQKHLHQDQVTICIKRINILGKAQLESGGVKNYLGGN